MAFMPTEDILEDEDEDLEQIKAKIHISNPCSSNERSKRSDEEVRRHQRLHRDEDQQETYNRDQYLSKKYEDNSYNAYGGGAFTCVVMVPA
uniref:Uncharacterized protein n=1 Tax=Glossina pallidipes TaxID=7398 RepID=A0A1B0A7N2_GLOPL